MDSGAVEGLFNSPESPGKKMCSDFQYGHTESFHRSWQLTSLRLRLSLTTCIVIVLLSGFATLAVQMPKTLR
jgi:hypothetical protein